jgi:hypothetical protein
MPHYLTPGTVVKVGGNVIGVVQSGQFAGDWVACGCGGYHQCDVHAVICAVTQYVATHEDGPVTRARALGLVARLARQLGASEDDTVGSLTEDAARVEEVSDVIDR